MQIQTGVRSDLVDLLCAISTRLVVIDSNSVLEDTGTVLARHRITDAAYITIGVDEWDDGYFYSGIRGSRP